MGVGIGVGVGVEVAPPDEGVEVATSGFKVIDAEERSKVKLLAPKPPIYYFRLKQPQGESGLY